MYGDYQYEIYLEGMAGVVPELPMDLRALEALARERLSPEAFDYVAGSAGQEETAAANREAFSRWRIVPRMLRDVSVRDLSVTVAGTALPAPVMLAPIGVQSIVHQDAELAVARACAEVGAGMCLSTLSSHPLEEVAEAAGDAPRWFQLYWPRDDALAASFVGRAEEAGYTAIVVTLDTWLIGWRPRDLQRAYLPFLQSEGIANYLTDPVFRDGLDVPPEEDPDAAVSHWVQVYADASTEWSRVERLRAQTDLPILLKGILHPDDARRAVETGVDGLVVSNHGGRQVDGAIGALDALPAIVAAVGEELDIVFDSGVRTGADAVKALCLGADAVFLGRPYAWGLGLAGQDGVRHVLKVFFADLDLQMALSGHVRVEQLGRHVLTAATAGPG